MKNILIKAAKPIAFIGILVFMLSLLGQLFYPRNNESDPSMKSFEARKIFAEEKNTIDVIALGHSRVYAGFSPMEMYAQNGITSFCCSEPLQTPWEAYFLIKDVFKKQKPKLIIYEVDQLFYNNAVKSVNSAAASFFTRTFPVIEFHNNWKKISFKPNKPAPARRANKGYRFFEGAKGIDYRPLPPTDAREKMSALNVSFIKKIMALAEKNGAHILFVAMPSRTSWTMLRHNTIADFAAEKNITFIDLNQPETELAMGLDWQEDTRDRGDHLNHKGAVKVSKYLGNYITENYDIPDRRNDASCSYWQEDYKEYLKLTKENSPLNANKCS